MSNMSYCKFQNTYRDLLEARERMNEVSDDELSDTERHYKQKLIELCSAIVIECEVEELD